MTETSGFKKWLPLAVLALALFIVVLDSTILSVSIKAIIGDLHTNLKAVQWVITSYTLVLAAFTITGGRLGDIFGRKRMFMVGAVLFGVGSLLASRAHSQPFLLFSVSAIEGLGAAMMLPSTAALILAQYRGKDRALAFGVYGAIAGAAATIGPLLGGFLTTNYSWRWNYLINPVVVIVLLAGSVFLKESQERIARRPDILSIIFSAIGMGGVVYGIVESSTYGWLKSKMNYEIGGHHYHLAGLSITLYAILAGLLFVVCFLWRQYRLEIRKKLPLVSIGLFKNGQFMSGTVVLLIAIAAQFGLIFVLPVFFQGLLGKDAFHTGLAVLPFSVSIGLTAPLSGVLVGKFDVSPRLLIQIGLALSTCGALLIHQELRVTSTEWSLAPGMAFFGLGFGFTISQLANLTLSAVSVEQAGEASGVNNTFRQLGSSLGQALIGAILIASLTTQLNTDVAKSAVLPNAAKPAITKSIVTATQSLGTQQNGADAPLAVTQEIMRIKNDAIVTGAKAGTLTTASFVFLALLFSLRLPKRVEHGQDVDAPAAR
ncbi:MAG: MFS transporter [Candidatus Saccharibacteria bacterium]